MRYGNRILGILGIWLASTLIGPVLAQDLTVDGYSLVSKSRVSRTDFEYTYHADITNTGSDVENVTATLSSTSTHTTVVDGDLSFGSIGADSTVPSSETFTIRQNRRYPFSWADMSWDVSFDLPPPQGMLLGGNPSDLAMTALIELPPKAVDDSQILDGIILSRLTVAISRSATVGEVNQALLQFGARIVDMRPGSPYMTFAIPQQPTISAITAIANQLTETPGIRIAFPAQVPGPARLPPEHRDPGNLRDSIRHLMPSRFPAAWNAAGLIEFDENGNCARRVKVLVPDYFYIMMPASYETAALDQIFPAFPITPDPSQPENLSSGNHGFDVIATMGAQFDATPPTGAMPLVDCFDFVGVPINGYSWHQILWITAANFPETGKFLINASLSDNRDRRNLTPTQANTGLWSPVKRAEMALEWRLLAMDRKDDFLVLSAAGNDGRSPLLNVYPGTVTAAYSNPFSAAAIVGDPLLQFAADVAAWGGNGVYPDLTASAAQMLDLGAELTAVPGLDQVLNNVLVVGSVGCPTCAPSTTTGAPSTSELRTNLTESGFSDRGADIYAVGEDIPVLDLSRTLDGTSFAAPQVTGLAAYLWLIAPELRQLPAQVTRYLIEHSVSTTGDGNNLIDAYLAALTFDLDPDMIGIPVIQFGEAPVREAILDIDGDELFDEDDLKRYLWAYYDGHFLDPNATPTVPLVRDYSRFDLNGDGFTGGSLGGCDGGAAGPQGCSERFDLDLLASEAATPVYDTDIMLPITLPGSSTAIQRSFDENVLTDLEILCYYAFSPLYQGVLSGDALEGLTWLSDCVDIETRLDLPEEIHLGSTVRLGANVQDADGRTLVDSTVVGGDYFRWSSSDPEVAIVDSAGRVHIAGPGTTTLRASYGRASTTSTIEIPTEGLFSRSVPVAVTSFRTELGECSVDRGDSGFAPFPFWEEEVWSGSWIFTSAVLLEGAPSVDGVGTPAIAFERATEGRAVPSNTVLDVRGGDLVLSYLGMDTGILLLYEVTGTGADSDGCPYFNAIAHQYHPYVAARWPLWRLDHESSPPFVSGFEQPLWVAITPPDPLALDAGAIRVQFASDEADLKIEIASANSVNIEGVAPWIVSRTSALNPIDERERIVVILEHEGASYEIDLELTVHEVEGNRYLEVEDLVGWRCGVGRGAHCPGSFSADLNFE